jgi:hypothetical protein
MFETAWHCEDTLECPEGIGLEMFPDLKPLGLPHGVNLSCQPGQQSYLRDPRGMAMS